MQTNKDVEYLHERVQELEMVYKQAEKLAKEAAPLSMYATCFNDTTSEEQKQTESARLCAWQMLCRAKAELQEAVWAEVDLW